ncbi:MAG TPA: plasma-membrane proton-efflux P-type ATPase, partial [Pseudonocardiaceae bacterium]|nr:plasma-membrane proton-efflux P-type ATPase [Pseudonocardiaceae bacterium]
VPGDVIRARLGDVVPADARVLAGGPLQVDQSALTGESLPVTAGGGDPLFSGSVVVRGEADALVFATGGSTFFGRTASLVETAGTVSHFQRAVLRIGHYLILAALVLVALTLVVSLARGNPPLQMVQFALVVTIASVPVALPAVLSVTMAVGARELARQEAVVSHLPAVEELGGIDVLCADKTGTLTQNRLAAGAPWTAPGVDVVEVLTAAALASRSEDRDPIDAAVLAALPDQKLLAGARVQDYVPFDPVTKRTEGLVHGPNQAMIRVSKGAPQVIASLCPDDPAALAMTQAVERFAVRGYRSLGVARAEGDGPWRVLGVLPLADPPRTDSAATLAAARDLGVSVKMLTGDQLAIGREIARQVGLGEAILPADALDPDAGTRPDEDRDTALAARVERADGFAQVFPEHKYRIVRLLQARGHILGMTGDGVNDAPALKQADAGIAVAGATDAARAAADVVLLAPGLSVIVSAIRLAREIFARMTSYATYRIAETIRVLLLISLAIVVMNFFPITAIMIVLLAVLNDGAILSIAYDHVRGSPPPGDVGHAYRAHRRHGSRAGRRRCIISVVRPGRSGARPRPRHDPNLDLPQAVGRRSPHHLPHPHSRAVLVSPRTGPAAVRRGNRHPAAGHSHRRLRAVHDPDRLGPGPRGVGVRPDLVRCQRPAQTAHLPLAEPPPLTPPAQPGNSADVMIGRPRPTTGSVRNFDGLVLVDRPDADQQGGLPCSRNSPTSPPES